MLGSLLQSGYQFAKRSPLLRKLVRQPAFARVKASLATSLGIRDVKYERWLKRYLIDRRMRYGTSSEPGLLSFLTTVWNTPVQYLRVLSESLLSQAETGEFEWVVLDNGSVDPQTCAYLREVVAPQPRVKFFRVDQNRGIIGGMRLCLEQASGRYVLPLDSDDLLYPDCISILTRFLQEHGYPPLIYSDEDHLLGTHPVQPYFKPDWDPVLCLNSPYIAHLCAIDRRMALDLNVYGDSSANGCHDWDSFLKFVVAGHTPVHLPEILYSWRMHGRSTAANIHSKCDIHPSHQAVLARYLTTLPHPERFSAEISPLFEGAPEWWIRRRPVDPRPLLSIVLSEGDACGATDHVLHSCDYPAHRALAISYATPAARLLELLEAEAACDGLVCLVSQQLKIENREWPWEALGLFERFSDAAMVGGRIHDRRGNILDAGRFWTFDAGCSSPDAGRSLHDAGYFTQMWKQRTVDAVPGTFCVFEGSFLRNFLTSIKDKAITPDALGPLAGAYATKCGRRVIYTPFLCGEMQDVSSTRNAAMERAALQEMGIPSQSQWYPRWLSRDEKVA